MPHHTRRVSADEKEREMTCVHIRCGCRGAKVTWRAHNAGGMTGAGMSTAGRDACPALLVSTALYEKGRTFLSGPSVICSPCDSACSLTAARKGANAAEGR